MVGKFIFNSSSFINTLNCDMALLLCFDPLLSLSLQRLKYSIIWLRPHNEVNSNTIQDFKGCNARGTNSFHYAEIKRASLHYARAKKVVNFTIA